MSRPHSALRALGPGLLALSASCGDGESGRRATAPERLPAPVEVAPVEQATITLRRTFSGALEAVAEVMIAPRVAGHLERLDVDIGDVIERGQVVAWLDDAELLQAVAQADAELAVAAANVDEAVASEEIAERALQRVVSLREQGVASGTELDAARATALARSSRVAVTRAQVTRANAALESARIRLGEARVIADWEEPAPAGDGGPGAIAPRLVAARYVDEGSIVTPSTPLLSIVALDPVVAVVFVPERDYARLAVGLEATLETDAYPGETFSGRVARVAPVFSRATRQVRVELEVENHDLRLKPGMFVRATLVLATEAAATVVPYDALARRGDRVGVFVLADGSSEVTWRTVREGIREGARVQLLHEAPLTGRVVTLGQELCDDGSTVSVIDTRGPAAGAARETAPAGEAGR